MEEIEYVVVLISHIKELRDKLSNIGEKIYNTYLVTITLNGMIEDYQIFITRLVVRQKAPTFEELIGILMQEEERHMNLKPWNVDLALVSKKKFYKGKPRGGQNSDGPCQK